jgi:hypothetical protein
MSAPTTPLTFINKERSVYVIAQNYKTTVGFYVNVMAPWSEYYVVLMVASATGNPGPGLLLVFPLEYLNLSPTVYFVDDPVIMPFGPGGNSEWGARLYVKSLMISVQIICNTCNTSNYYTIDLYLSKEI